MRGQQERSGSLFSCVSIEERIPASHPLRRIRKLADQALDRLNCAFSPGCSCQQLSEPLLGGEATRGHVAPAAVIDPQVT
jgi:hypothetical protein